MKQVLPDPESELLLVIDQFEELFTHCRDDDGTPAVHRRPGRRGDRSSVAAAGAGHDAGRLLRPAASLPGARRAVRARRAVARSAGTRRTRTGDRRAGGEGRRHVRARTRRAHHRRRHRPARCAAAAAVHADGALRPQRVGRAHRARLRAARRAVRRAREAGGGACTRPHRPDQQAATRRLFTRLTTPGDGVEDTRRRVLRTELERSDAVDAVIDAYGAARLLAFDHDQATRTPTIEVAHEALLRAWPRLRRWLDEDRDGLRLHRHLTMAASAWDGLRPRPGRALSRWTARGRRSVGRAARVRPQRERDRVHRRVDRCRSAPTCSPRRASQRRLRRLLVGVACIAVVAIAAGAARVPAAITGRRQGLPSRDRATGSECGNPRRDQPTRRAAGRGRGVPPRPRARDTRRHPAGAGAPPPVCSGSSARPSASRPSRGSTTIGSPRRRPARSSSTRTTASSSPCSPA